VLVVWPDDYGSVGVLSDDQFGGGGWTAPVADVLNASTQNGNAAGNGGIAPGEVVALTGFGIGPASGVAQPDPHGNIPSQLAGVQVFFDGMPAPVLCALSRQINAAAPAGLTINETTQVTVTYNDQHLGSVAVPVVSASQEFSACKSRARRKQLR
jgi:uncharacterized protein (TIGR03437 family)